MIILFHFIFDRFNSPYPLYSSKWATIKVTLNQKFPTTGSTKACSEKWQNAESSMTGRSTMYYQRFIVAITIVFVYVWVHGFARKKRGSIELEQISWANQRVNRFYYMCVCVLLVCSYLQRKADEEAGEDCIV